VKERCTKSSEYYIENHTFRVYFGDMNFRLFNDLKSIKKMIIMQDYHEMMKSDEFLQQHKISN